MSQTFKSSQLEEIVTHVIAYNPIRQGIIGIFVPDLMGTVEQLEFIQGLYEIHDQLNYDIQQVILPPPNHKFKAGNPTEMEALARRVKRDHDDGIRYNRVYFAVYTEYPTDNVIKSHDMWFDTHKEGSQHVAVVTNYREIEPQV